MKANVCPSCGAPPTVVKTTTAELYALVCSSNYCATVGARKPTENKAVSAWNSIPTAVVRLPTAGANTEHVVKGVIGKPGLKVAKTPKRAIPVTNDLSTKVATRLSKGTTPTVARGGIGAFIRELLQEGCDTKMVLERLKKKFPESKATAADVSWNRRKLAGKE